MIILFIFNFLRPSQKNNRYYVLNLSNSRKVIDVRAVKNGRKKIIFTKSKSSIYPFHWYITECLFCPIWPQISIDLK